VESIREHDLLADFPDRTEADLYLWIAFHREELAKRYELAPLSPDAAVRTFASVHSDKLLQQALKAVTLGFRRTFGSDEIPPGLSEEEFEEARARYAAGERTIAEAEEERRASEEETAEMEAAFALMGDSGAPSDPYYDDLEAELDGVTPLPAASTATAGRPAPAPASNSGPDSSPSPAGTPEPAPARRPYNEFVDLPAPYLSYADDQTSPF
jgi:hypothetical protein